MSPESVIVVAYFSASASGSLEEEGGDGGGSTSSSLCTSENMFIRCNPRQINKCELHQRDRSSLKYIL